MGELVFQRNLVIHTSTKNSGYRVGFFSQIWRNLQTFRFFTLRSPNSQEQELTFMKQLTQKCGQNLGQPIFHSYQKTHSHKSLRFWSRGQDISQETAGSYVKANARPASTQTWDCHDGFGERNGEIPKNHQSKTWIC